jgi:hypothetical protein
VDSLQRAKTELKHVVSQVKSGSSRIQQATATLKLIDTVKVLPSNNIEGARQSNQQGEQHSTSQISLAKKTPSKIMLSPMKCGIAPLHKQVLKKYKPENIGAGLL